MENLDLEVQKCIEAEGKAVPERANMEWADGAIENFVVLMYELGAVCKDYIYGARSEDDDIVRARAANSIVEVADIVTQSLIIFTKLKKMTKSLKDMTAEEFIMDGLERQQERMTEIIDKRINYKV